MDPSEIAPSDLLVGTPKYDSNSIAELAGMEIDDARRIWRSMGFPEPPEGEPFFTDSDLEALRKAKKFLDAGYADVELVVNMARVLSQSLALAARAEADTISERVLAADGLDMELQDVPGVLTDLESFLTHIWRRHLASALESEGAWTDRDSSASENCTVGFADLVGFTRLSRHVTERELTELVESFDSQTQAIIAEMGGKVVKTIGDEVMYYASDPASAAEAALRMAEAFPDDGKPPTLRVGLATGPVVRYRGDLLGSTVNLASRAVGEARPGTVLTSEGTKEALASDDRYGFKPIRARHLRGVGTTRLWSLRRAE